MPADVKVLALERPRSLKAALATLAGDPALTPIAGCTDVYVGLHFGTLPQRRFIDLWGLKELGGISVSGDVLRIGALTTYTEIIESKVVQKRAPILVAASREVGGAQIQNRGTLGGNIANASPAGDTLPVLVAANARIVLRSIAGTRTVPFETFYTGYRQSVRRPDELIVAIEIPRIDGRQWWRKVGTRRAQAISKIMMAGVRGHTVRIGVGSVAPTVVLARKTAEVLMTGGSIADAQAALRSEITPIDDVRSTGEYRAAVAANLLEEFLDIHPMIIRATIVTLLLATPALAQDALTSRVMTAVRSAVAPAVPFPVTDDSGSVPANGSTEALWMVRWPEPGDRMVEVIANPLNEANQLRASRAMAQIEHNIEAAQRRATIQYDRAVSEAKRTGRSQDVDGVTLSDEGTAGAKIDAESHLVIDVEFNQPAYRREVESGVQPNPSMQLQGTIPSAVAIVTLPSNTWRDNDIERFCEAETIVYLGRVSKPEVKKRGDTSGFEVTAAATPADGAAIASIVVRFRGNDVLMADVLRKISWDRLVELLK